jgi:hypothetical protein
VVGQVAIEGLSTISAMLMQDHIRNLRKIAEDIVGDFSGQVEVADVNGRVTNESLKFGKSGKGIESLGSVLQRFNVPMSDHDFKDIAPITSNSGGFGQ